MSLTAVERSFQGFSNNFLKKNFKDNGVIFLNVEILKYFVQGYFYTFFKDIKRGVFKGFFLNIF